MCEGEPVIRLAVPGQLFKDFEFIEHPLMPVIGRSLSASPKPTWSWISLCIGDIDMGKEPEIDTSQMSIPGLFRYRIPVSEINCLNETQFIQNRERINQEREVRIKLLRQLQAKDRYQIMKLRETRSRYNS